MFALVRPLFFEVSASYLPLVTTSGRHQGFRSTFSVAEEPTGSTESGFSMPTLYTTNTSHAYLDGTAPLTGSGLKLKARRKYKKEPATTMPGSAHPQENTVPTSWPSAHKPPLCVVPDLASWRKKSASLS